MFFKRRRLIGIIFIFLSHLPKAKPEDLSGTRNLLFDLFESTRQKYDTNIVPRANSEHPLELTLGIALNQVLDVDEYHQVITLSAWMRMQWQVAHISWDPAAYNGTETLNIPISYLWRPDLVLLNNADASKVGAMVEDIPVTLDYTGVIRYNYPVQFQSACHMDFYHFPRDVQRCQLVFGSWTYDGHALDLRLRPIHAADLTNTHPNSGWKLLEFGARRQVMYYNPAPESPFPLLKFHIIIKRQYIMQFFYLVIPNLLINLTAVMQFLLPCDSGERITLGITVYLSMVVYLLLIQELIPASDTVPILVIYIVATLLMVTVSQLTTILTMRLHHNGTHDNNMQVPNWVRRVFLHGLARIICMHDSIVPDEVHESKISTSHTDTTGIIIEDEVEEDEERVESEAEIQVNEATINSFSIDNVNRPASPEASARMGGGGGSRSGSKVSPFATVVPIPPISPTPVHKKCRDSLTEPRDLLNRIRHKRSSIKIVGCSDPSNVVARSELNDNKEYLLYKLLRVNEELRDKKLEEEKQIELKCEWQQLAMIVDRCMLYVYSLGTTVLWAYMFMHLPSEEGMQDPHVVND